METETGAAKSVSTERTFDEDIASHAELETVLRGLSRELCEGLREEGAPRADGRDQGAAGGLDDGDAGADAGGCHERRGARDSTAVELLHAYAPPQPVRLLGVRLAAFDDLEPDRPPAPVAPVGQLALPL